MIYFDNNATLEYSPIVKHFIQNEMLEKWANPSSEYEIGRLLADEIQLIRRDIAEFLSISSKEVVFTSGATESINSVLSLENLKLQGISRVVTSHLEHHATLDRVKFLEKNGIKVQFVSNDEEGNLNIEEITDLVTSSEKTIFSFLFVNNEIGTINDIELISKIIEQTNHQLHIDASQALGKLKFDLSKIEYNYVSFSGHKIGSLKGIGLLIIKDIKNFQPLLHGGGQERGLRPGTINFSVIKTLKLAIDDTEKWNLKHIQELRDYFEKKVIEISGIKINATKSSRVCNTSNIYCGGTNSREVVMQLSRLGMYVSTGSACSSGSFEPSHVITALGKSKDYANSCMRVSFSASNTKEEVDEFVYHLRKILKPCDLI